MDPVHPNPHVVDALTHLSAALWALNAAGSPYDIGVTGVDEPYGMVERAARRVLEHAAPDLKPEDVEHARIDGNDTFHEAIEALRADRRELLRVYEERVRNGWPGWDEEAIEEDEEILSTLREEIARIPR